MIALPRLGLVANDNRAPVDVTRLTMLVFGPGLLAMIAASALLLARAW